MPKKSETEKEMWERLRKKPEFRTPVTFLGCPEALRVVKYARIKISEIAPTDPETHNGVRVNVIDDVSVNEFKIRIQNKLYDPFLEEPPVVICFPKNSPLYKKGYRYRKVDGHTRVEAHSQLGIDWVEVAIVEFLPVQGQSAEFWMYAFMIEKNDPKKGRFHRKASTATDLEQSKELLLAAKTKNSKFVPETDDVPDTYREKQDSIHTEAKNLANLLGTTTATQIRNIEDSLTRAYASDDPEILRHFIHVYNSRGWKTAIKNFYNTIGVERENILDRPYYSTDADCSRDDYTQFCKLIEVGMDNVNNLKKMAFLGAVKVGANDRLIDVDVYATRRRKSQLVQKMITFIGQMHNWLSVERNRQAILDVPMFWLTQTYDETKKYSVNTVGPMDYNSGQVTELKKVKKCR